MARRLLLLAVAASLCFGYQAAPKLADLPFTMTWIRGKCGGCNVAAQLETVQFTTPTEAWGVGHRWPPPGAEGVGDYIAVHSKDGGRSWTEIPHAQTHAAAPSVFFVNPLDGWLSWLVVTTGEIRTQRTRDGGKSWQDVGQEIVTFPGFFDESHWYAVNDGIFLATDDAGGNWHETQVPLLPYVTRVFFLSRDVGWITSTDLSAVAVSRTVDGGRTWTDAAVTTPLRSNRAKDLFFVDSMRGWLVVEHDVDPNGVDHGSDLFSTMDGGVTWTPERDTSFQGPNKYLGPVRFLSDKLGFIFENAKGRSSFLFTIDGGMHWRKQPVRQFVSDCQIFKGDLRCSASDAASGFWVLTIHPK